MTTGPLPRRVRPRQAPVEHGASRLMRYTAALLAILSAATPGSLEAQSVDSVSLRFAWPIGMSARVEQEWTRVQESPEKRDSTYVRSTYRLQALPHPSGRLIQVDSF